MAQTSKARPGVTRRSVTGALLCAPFARPVFGQTGGGATLFEGARLIPGDGSVPIEDSAFVIIGEGIAAVGRRGEVTAPAGASRVDLTGKTVMPALIDDHVHMGYRRGTTFSADNYTRENLLDNLDRFAFWGIAAVLETGTGRGDLPYMVRAEATAGTRYLTAGSGFGMPGAGPGGAMRDSAYGVTDVAQARRDVQELAEHKPDMVKIWVDDRNHTVEKLRPDLYRAIIDEAHRHGIRVMAHVVELEDAKDLLRAGLDCFAHMIRDKEVDDEILGMLRQRPDVFFVSTLWGERRAIYAAPPNWVNDPGLRQSFSATDIGELSGQLTPDANVNDAGAQRARAMGQMNLRNTAKLHAAGVRIGVGTDTGGVTGGQFFGLGSHVEVELLATRVGLTPMQAIVAGTRVSAQNLRLDRLGTLAAGNSADFLVLDANPLDSISNTRRISQVYLRGRDIPRSALSAKWAAGG